MAIKFTGDTVTVTLGDGNVHTLSGLVNHEQYSNVGVFAFIGAEDVPTQISDNPTVPQVVEPEEVPVRILFKDHQSIDGIIDRLIKLKAIMAAGEIKQF
jgi:hypothetical protein